MRSCYTQRTGKVRLIIVEAIDFCSWNYWGSYCRHWECCYGLLQVNLHWDIELVFLLNLFYEANCYAFWQPIWVGVLITNCRYQPILYFFRNLLADWISVCLTVLNYNNCTVLFAHFLWFIHVIIELNIILYDSVYQRSYITSNINFILNLQLEKSITLRIFDPEMILLAEIYNILNGYKNSLLKI